MSQGTVANMLARVTKSVEPIYKGIQQSISEAAVVGSDETSVKVKGQKDWMWVWQSQSASFIAYEQSRGYVSIIKNFPNGFKSSTLVSDALSAQLKTPAQKHWKKRSIPTQGKRPYPFTFFYGLAMKIQI